jgi:hypothetical protein
MGRGKKRKGGKDGMGWRGGRVRSLFCFFLLFFQILFKPNCQTFLNQFFTQISPTIFKGFSQTLLSTFQTYSKFKPSPFNSSFYTNFHKLFHNYFKDFFANILRLLKPHHSQNSCIST